MPDRVSAETFAERARAGGYAVEVVAGANHSMGCRCWRIAVPNLAKIKAMRRELRRWNEDLEGQVSDWHAVIKR